MPVFLEPETHHQMEEFCAQIDRMAEVYRKTTVVLMAIQLRQASRDFEERHEEEISAPKTVSMVHRFTSWIKQELLWPLTCALVWLDQRGGKFPRDCPASLMFILPLLLARLVNYYIFCQPSFRATVSPMEKEEYL